MGAGTIFIPLHCSLFEAACFFSFRWLKLFFFFFRKMSSVQKSWKSSTVKPTTGFTSHYRFATFVNLCFPTLVLEGWVGLQSLKHFASLVWVCLSLTLCRLSQRVGKKEMKVERAMTSIRSQTIWHRKFHLPLFPMFLSSGWSTLCGQVDIALVLSDLNGVQH